jgi:hypothetical protein
MKAHFRIKYRDLLGPGTVISTEDWLAVALVWSWDGVVSQHVAEIPLRDVGAFSPETMSNINAGVPAVAYVTLGYIEKYFAISWRAHKAPGVLNWVRLYAIIPDTPGRSTAQVAIGEGYIECSSFWCPV